MNNAFLDKIRAYLKQEESEPAIVFDFVTPDDTQQAINQFYVQMGREQMLADILKWEQKMSEREFQIARKKGNL